LETLSVLLSKARLESASYPGVVSSIGAPAPRRIVPRRVIRWIVSQFLAGELATAAFCERMAKHVSDVQAREFLTLQGMDERRHAALYRWYLECLDLTPAPSLSISKCYDAALSPSTHPLAAILAFHVILERDNLRLQSIAETWFGCRVYSEMGTRIRRDEARHVAFGRLYLQERLPLLPLTERQEIYRWVRGLWFEAGREILANCLVPGPADWLLEKTQWPSRIRDLELAGLFSGEEREEFRRL